MIRSRHQFTDDDDDDDDDDVLRAVLAKLP